MDVAGWLRGLGLGQYEANFRDNKIGADVLPRLTDDDLKDIGVSALGDRRRLLDAIAALGGAKPPETSPSPRQNLRRPKVPEVSAERRPITVMFCDLVGSTSLAAKLDAEDWRNLVNAYLDEASKAVTGFGGHVLKRLGDGLMALFGYPQAQENDAERAVRAALAIQRALADLNARNARRARPSFPRASASSAGPVVVEAAGEVFGDAPNVAARVQAAAEPGTVLVTVNVQRQVGRAVRRRGQGRARAQGRSGAGRALSHRAGERRRPARRRAGADAVRRPRGGARASGAPLGARARGRGPVRPDRRRTRHRQVAARSRSSTHNSPRRRTPGSNGAPRSSCRTRRCTRSPNGAGCASAAPIRPPSSASPISKTLCG